MEDRPPLRFPVVVAAAFLFVGFINDGLALSTSVLVDAGQAPYPHKEEKAPLTAASGCPVVGCTVPPGVGETAASSASPNDDVATTKAPEAEPGNATPAQSQDANNINKPAKKSHNGDAALVQPASQYHYYGGSTEERRTRNVHLYPTPMKRKYADYSRLKRSTRLSPKEVLALLSLWERPVPREEEADNRIPKHEDMGPAMLLDDDEDEDGDYGAERDRESWDSVVRPYNSRYSPDDFYRNEARKRNWQQERLPQRYLAVDERLPEARKRFDRLVQEQLNQLRKLIRDDREREDSRAQFQPLAPANDLGSFASPEWEAPPEYKRRTSFGTTRNKPEENKYHRWLQGQ